MPKIFGWEFAWDRKSSKPLSDSPKPTGTTLSPIPPDNQDGALNIQYGSGGGYYGYYLDLDGAIVDDFQLINRYREMQVIAEVDEAIDQIINEMVVQDAGRMPVSLDMDYIDDDVLDEKTKIRIQAEFDSLLKQLHLHKDGYSVVRQWYVDGRIYYHLLVDENSPEDGIQELRLIDPRTIRKVREVTRKRHDETQMDLVEVQREYFVYNPMGFVAPTNMAGQSGATASMLQTSGVKLTLDSVAFCPSGLYDANKKTVLSWLHKAIKPLNLMRMMEDSCVIYRVSRAPERRVFYIDVGNLPKAKAEQYLYDIMQKYRNKLVYDVSTGDIRDDRKFMSIMEDFWLPRREGGKGTEITTLPAGQNLSEMEDVDYFRRKLYRALNLPPSRIDQGTGFSLGKSTEISRDELRFSKFIHRLHVQFNTLFDQLLERQLRLKQILTEQEWYQFKDNIRYNWQTDSYFEELKSQDMWINRLNLVTQMDSYVNKYFSQRWITREVLKFTDDEWASMREEFDDMNVDPFGGGGMGGGTDEDGNPLPPGEEGEDGDGGGNPFGKKKAPFGKKGIASPFGKKSMDDEADEILVSTKNGDDEDDDKDVKGKPFGMKLDDEDDDPKDDEDDEDDDSEDDDEDVKDDEDKDEEDDDEDDKKKSKKPPFGKKTEDQS